MTRQRKDDKSTEFGLWLRGQLSNQKTDISSIASRPNGQSKGYDAQNLDYVWFQYMEDKVMLLEEKRYEGERTPSQKETHGLIDQALRFACESGYLFKRWRGRPREMQYHGYHVIQFEHTNPEDGWTKVDGQLVTIEEFLSFLQFE